MSLELKKRIFTSFFLFLLLYLMHSFSYILIISLIIIATITWIEFYGLISKIFNKQKNKHNFLRFFNKSISLIYLTLLVFWILFIESKLPELKIIIIYSISISIGSDIGGLLFGKILKGKKLTKISPNKTIAGAVGSIFFSLMLIPIFSKFFPEHSIYTLFIITILICLTSQVGDLFVSYLKRKAKVKDTSNLLPGHGGFLDRIDGIIFSIPVGLLLFNL